MNDITSASCPLVGSDITNVVFLPVILSEMARATSEHTLVLRSAGSLKACYILSKLANVGISLGHGTFFMNWTHSSIDLRDWHSKHFLVAAEDRRKRQRRRQQAMRMSPNKRFNQQNNGCARALWIFVQFFAVPCKSRPWNDQVLRRARNANDDV